jgi:hypothetical protein
MQKVGISCCQCHRYCFTFEEVGNHHVQRPTRYFELDLVVGRSEPVVAIHDVDKLLALASILDGGLDATTWTGAHQPGR